MSSDNNAPEENSNHINNGEPMIENTFTPATEPVDNIPTDNNNVEQDTSIQVSTPSPVSSRRTSKTEESNYTSNNESSKPIAIMERKIVVADSNIETDWFAQR